VGDLGHNKVFCVELPATPSGASTKGGYAVLEVEEPLPYALTGQHTASLAQSLPNGRLLFTQNSLTTPNNLWLLSRLDRPNEPLKLKQISYFAETHLQEMSLSSAEEFWFEGAKGVQVHGFALKPRGWEEGKKKAYPAVLLIHGGPQSAWEDAWSTRWNPNGRRLVWGGGFFIHPRFC
jgi:dipeptidyl aminopeptidase/acylaminoacyl peptidase